MLLIVFMSLVLSLCIPDDCLLPPCHSLNKIIPLSRHWFSCQQTTRLSLKERQRAAQCIDSLFKTQLVGQTSSLLNNLIRVTRAKLQRPERPLILHLAGDHGVGKTFTAELLSLATSRHCAASSSTSHGGTTSRGSAGRLLTSLVSATATALTSSSHASFPHRSHDGLLDPSSCRRGDNLLIISLTNYEFVTNLSAARDRILFDVCSHLRLYPHGIILLDDAQSAPRDLLRRLKWIFGYGDDVLMETSEEYNGINRIKHVGERRKEKEKLFGTDWHKRKQRVEKKYLNDDSYRSSLTGERRMDATGQAMEQPNHPFDSNRSDETHQTHASLSQSQRLITHSSCRGIRPSDATIILTTDFGREGRTRGFLSQSQLEQIVARETGFVTGFLTAESTRGDGLLLTLPYSPLESPMDIRLLIQRRMNELPCRLGGGGGMMVGGFGSKQRSVMIDSVNLKPIALEWMMQKLWHRQPWEDLIQHWHQDANNKGETLSKTTRQHRGRIPFIMSGNARTVQQFVEEEIDIKMESFLAGLSLPDSKGFWHWIRRNLVGGGSPPPLHLQLEVVQGKDGNIVCRVEGINETGEEWMVEL